ncbi:GcrA family cell cycle regulator [Pseudoroseomonas cervicalis]|uniref:GcrA family cell cycle regulator n=1 Tax=Teichococcus cervicalis TaxID=204525 RepID=UPI0022F1ADDC|nr:GcrA family cell cycle regulator [Pseudoroseomonas cervicalis]WBV42284.1 GcrA cell cycle regulator [Pseudoroseomonas cervicalis]
MEWTAEAIETLRALWAEGHSTAEIGRRMGISKNAVVGKAHRLNLPARPSPIRREAEAAAPVAPAPAPAPVAPPVAAAAPVPPPASAPKPAVAEPAPMAAMVTLAPATAPAMPAPNLAAPRPPAPPRRAAPAPGAVVRPFQRSGGRSCCWPIGEPGTPEFRFCTAEAIPSKPYCPEHAAIAYVKARDRRDDAA